MITHKLIPIEEKISDFMLVLGEALSQRIKVIEQVKLRASILKLHQATGETIPRETFPICSKISREKVWSVVLYNDGTGSVKCDLYWGDKDSSTRNEHITGIVVLDSIRTNKPAKPNEIKDVFIMDTLPISTPYEVVKKISKRHTEIGLNSDIDGIKEMIDIVLKNGVGGSGAVSTSPLYVYDKPSGLITVDYSHIEAVGEIVVKDHYRVSETTVKLGFSPNLLDYTTDEMVGLTENGDPIQGVTYADSIDELFRVLSCSFPVTVLTALGSLKELLKNNQSSDGNWKVLGYHKPVIECGVNGYWSANNGVRVSLSKELIEEITLFDLGLPLSTKGDIIIDICKNVNDDYTFDQARALINKALHSSIGLDGGIEIRHSNTTKNIIVKIENKKATLGSWEQTIEQITLVYLVSEASLEIEEAPTLQSFIALPDINVKKWMERNTSERFGVVGSLESIDLILARAGIFSSNPFIELISENTVTVNDMSFTVLSGYHPSIEISSPMGSAYYLITKSVLEKIYDLKRNPPMTTINENQSSEGIIKEAFKAHRLHSLIKKLESTETPESAYDLIIAFLGDDYEQEGSVKYKGVKIKYLIGYTTHNGEVKLDVSVIDIKDSRNDEPVFALLVRFKRESVHRVYESIKRLVEMSR